MRSAKRPRLAAREPSLAEQAIRVNKGLRAALMRDLAPRASIIRHRPAWGAAVADLGRFAERLAGGATSSPAASDEAALWRITWCANAVALLMGAVPPGGAGAAVHSAVLGTAEKLAAAVERIKAAVRPELANAAHLDVVSPMLELYELVCFVSSAESQRAILRSSLAQPAQGGAADCLLMIPPILLPNLATSIRYMADRLAKNRPDR
jgi:hypothetical protein